MSRKTTKKVLSASILSACLLPSVALSALYISPVVKDSVTYDSSYVDGQGKKNDQIQGSSSIHGKFMMREHDSDQALLRFGENVPLFIAIEKVVPNTNQWSIHFDDGTENIAVNWDGGQSWEGILSLISRDNNIEIFVNSEEMAIGVSKNKELAEAMAHNEPHVWKLSSRKGLQENLKDWAKRSDKELIFSDAVKDVNYNVPDITIIGGLIEKGGALDQVLTNLNRTAHVKLEAKLSKDESQIVIVRAGHRKEMF